MGYLDDLAANEQVLLRAWRSKVIFWDTVIFTLLGILFAFCFFYFHLLWYEGTAVRAVVGFSPLLIALILLANDLIVYNNLEIAVTNIRLIVKKGIMALTVMDIPLNQITNMKVDMSAIGTKFNYGRIEISTPNGDFLYKKITDPLNIKNTINNALTQR